MKLVTCAVDRDRKFDNPIPSFHTAIYAAATDTVSDRTVPAPTVESK